MIFVALALLGVMLLLRFLQPKRYLVHGSKARLLPRHLRPFSRWSPGILRDPSGHVVAVGHRMIGETLGGSMAKFGLPDGSTFVGDFLSDDDRHSVANGEVVVVEESGGSLVLRRVEQVMADDVSFLPDGYGESHPSAPVASLKARVTHVVAPREITNPIGRWLDEHTPA